ncbi:MAG: D-aminoacyl-tRNA deacylase [Thermodesulfobacteriota bacterium]|nr:MAG: D-aminoacyl-tRNA deacylase [Thermodesulfobacteriota bacterium]
MRAVVQRVSSASVSVSGRITGAIERGLLVFVGVEKGDGPEDLEYTASKITGLRVFEDREGRMNLDVKEAGGSLLVISQFTLLGDCRKGKRPSFVRAEEPQRAREMYEALVKRLRESALVETGEFQAHMDVRLVNDGPVTVMLDSRKSF